MQRLPLAPFPPCGRAPFPGRGTDQRVLLLLMGSQGRSGCHVQPYPPRSHPCESPTSNPALESSLSFGKGARANFCVSSGVKAPQSHKYLWRNPLADESGRSWAGDRPRPPHRQPSLFSIGPHTFCFRRSWKATKGNGGQKRAVLLFSFVVRSGLHGLQQRHARGGHQRPFPPIPLVQRGSCTACPPSWGQKRAGRSLREGHHASHHKHQTDP